MTLEELKSIVDQSFELLEPLSLSLRLEQDAEERERLTKETGEATFWSDPKRASVVQKRITHLTKKSKRFTDLTSQLEDLSVLLELAEEEEDSAVLSEVGEGMKKWTHDYEILRLETLLTGEHDSLNAIVSLHAGAGGTEAQDWTSMLLRMYTRWSESHEFEVSVLDYIDGDEAGIKSVTLRIAGDNAYGYLRSEHGIHRLVRISPFDSSGRRHTSFASCEVLPELDDTIEINIVPDDLKIDTFRASGAGGQHVQ